MAATGTLGARLYISSVAIPATVDTESEFMAQTWVEVGLVESFGEFGRVFAPVNFQAVADGRMYKLKGGYDDGDIAFVLGQDLGDAGQAIMSLAGNSSTQDNYGIRIDLNDPDKTYGGPSTYFLRGLVMSYRSQMGSVNNVIKAASTVGVNSNILRINPSDHYDKFATGGSLAAYDLFKGSDAQAALPVIAANALSLVSGDDVAGTFAVNGSQSINDAGYILSAGPLVLEAKIKLDVNTTVGMFFGVTDQKVALEDPIEAQGVGDAFDTNATDAVGFVFDTTMTTDNIWLTGVNNNVDETPQDSGLAFVSNTYDVLRIEISASGTAVFYINGVAVGTPMTTACQTGVVLYPTLCLVSRSTVSHTMSVDYLYIRQDT